MVRGWTVLVACVVLLLASLAPVSSAAPGPSQDPAELEGLRERWERKSSEERQLLRQRFEELQSMGLEARERLFDRMRRLRAMELLLRGRAEVPGTGFGRCRELGRSLRESLAPGLRRRLEEARPEERRRILEGLRRSEREFRSQRAIRALGTRLGLPSEEIRRYEALPLSERLAVVLELERRRVEERVRERGLPRGLDAAEWAEIRSLGDDEFLRRMRTILPHRFPGPPGHPGRERRFRREPGRRLER